MTCTTANPLDVRRRRLWFWAIILFVCLLGGGLVVWQKAQQQRVRAAWNAQVAAMNARSLNTFQTMHDRLGKEFGSRREVTREKVEEILNQGRPLLDGPAKDGQETAIWKDDATGVYFELQFANGQLSGFTGSSWSRMPPGSRTPPPPSVPPLHLLTERIRLAFAGSFSLGCGTGVWLALLAGYVLLPRHRSLCAELLLALAFLCSTAWLVSRSLTLRGILSNDMLFWGVLMLPTSAGLMLRSRAKPHESAIPRCPTCGYNLTGNVSGICPECGERI
jgi:hypothetical protein